MKKSQKFWLIIIVVVFLLANYFLFKDIDEILRTQDLLTAMFLLALVMTDIGVVVMVLGFLIKKFNTWIDK